MTVRKDSIGRPQPPLTDKQARFAEEYLVDGNATAAALRAGYKTRSAYQSGYNNLHDPEVLARIAKVQQAITRRTEITVDKILSDLEGIRDKAIEAGQYSAAARCSELIGKHIGMWPDKTRLTHEFSNLTDSELVREATALLSGGMPSQDEANEGE